MTAPLPRSEAACAPPGALTSDVVFVRKAVLTVLMIAMSGLADGTRLPKLLITPKL